MAKVLEAPSKGVRPIPADPLVREVSCRLQLPHDVLAHIDMPGMRRTACARCFPAARVRVCT